MLKEAMLALRVTDMEYAGDIRRLLYAAKIDLEAAGVVITGDLDITVTETEDQTTHEVTINATDNSTITDEWVKTAMFTYAGARGNYAGREERAQLEESYSLQRRQLANRTGYTDFLEPEDETAEAAAETETTEPGTEPGTDPETEQGTDPETEPGTEASP